MSSYRGLINDVEERIVSKWNYVCMDEERERFI